MCRESDFVSHFRNVYLVIYKKVCGLLESYGSDEVAWRDVHGLLQLPVEVYSAHSDFAAEFFHAELAVFYVLAYDADHLGGKLAVAVCDLHLAVSIVDFAAEFVLDGLACRDGSGDCALEDVQ